MIAIPLALLGDSATVEAPDGSEFAGHYGDPWPLRFVRLETRVASVDREWATGGLVSAVLFVDATNSVPATPPPVGSRVTVSQGGSTLTGTVTEVRQLCDWGSHVHHWEVAIGG